MPPMKVLILALLLVIRFGGKDGNPMFLGSVDATFFGYGIVVGFSVVVPAILLTYCVGGDPSHVELALNCLGGVLFCALGGVAVMFDQGQFGWFRRSLIVVHKLLISQEASGMRRKW